MRLAVIILMLVTVFLAIKPGIGLSMYEKEAAEACCEEDFCVEESAETPHEEDDCCGDFCNPFQMCCSHIVFYPSVDITSLLPELPVANTGFKGSATSVLSKYVSDFWQPPRIV